MKSNLNDPQTGSKTQVETAADKTKHHTQTPVQSTNDSPSANPDNSDRTQAIAPSSWVIPTSIEKHLRWKRRRETWPPFLDVGIAFLALVAITAQAVIYYQQRQIMNTQSKFMNEQTKLMQHSLDTSDKSLNTSEESLRIGQRAYVGIASITANLKSGEIQIMLQNIGHVPAKGVKLDVQETRAIPGENGAVSETREIVNEKQFGSDFHWEAAEVQLFPGTPMYVVMKLKSFQPEEVAAILSKKEILYIGGTIQYEDGFRNCDYTTFAFRYDPLNKVWIADPGLSKVFKRSGC